MRTEQLLLQAGLTFLGLAAAQQVQAQESRPADTVQPGASDQTSAADPSGGDIVVVGSRGLPRATTDSASPVDVVSGETLQDRGNDDLAKKLQFLNPSFNYTRAATLASAVGARPVSLRGLAVDQVLVLVNGHRRHSAAAINTNNGFGRGTVPVDLNAIPIAAIERVEILRDGASAQYGSDAIAGVVNIVLRGDASGGFGSAKSGITENGDGFSSQFALRHGFGIGDGGFLTATAEIRTQDFTNAAGIDTRFGRITQRIGEPKAFDGGLTVNAEIPLGGATLYGNLSYFHRKTESSPIFRVPSTFPAFYPDGFLVLIRQETDDIGGTIGVRGSIGDWNWDVSDTAGYNVADFRPSNSLNTSLGTASPRSFDSGGARYGQNLVNITIDRQFDDVLAGANLAIGGEHRYEWYRIRRGEPNSYFGAGAQGFPGFNPPSPIDVDRTAYSAFIDAELSLVKGLTVGLAGRYEHYGDFGDKVTGKASLLAKPLDWLGLRGTISTGIRAPSLQQAHFATVTSQLVSGVLVNVGNFAVDDPVSRALGATSLRPETSKNYSAGIVLTPTSRLNFTADYFRIEIDGRITFSEALGGADVIRVLAANGITNASQVRFFTNAADTRTEGFELGAHWFAPLGAGQQLQLNLGYSDFTNKVTRLRQNPVLPNLPLLGSTSILAMTTTQPDSKFVGNATFDFNEGQLSIDAVRFGSYMFNPLGPVQTFGAKWSFDITASAKISDSARFTLGVINATNEYPDEVAGQIDGRRQLEAGGLGYNGREYFVRFSANF